MNKNPGYILIVDDELDIVLHGPTPFHVGGDVSHDWKVIQGMPGYNLGCPRFFTGLQDVAGFWGNAGSGLWFDHRWPAQVESGPCWVKCQGGTGESTSERRKGVGRTRRQNHLKGQLWCR